MKRVLVTGASGFIGRHCLQPLTDHGYEVHAVAHSHPLNRTAPVRWHRADLLDTSEVANLLGTVRPTHLLHFAWYADPKDYRTSPKNLLWCQTGIDLVRRFAEAGGQRAVFAGTCFEYDPRLGFLSENLTPDAPSTLYGACKSSLRQVVMAYATQMGLSAAWGRIFYVYGPHEAPRRLVPSVILSLIRGETARCTHGRQLRDFLTVQDVAAAFAAILESDLRGAVNIGSGEPTTIRALVSLIASTMNTEHRVEFGAITSAIGDPPAVIADVRLLRDRIGWTPRYSLEGGVASAIRWWQEQCPS